MSAAKKAANEAFEVFASARPEAMKEGFDKLAQSMTTLTEFNKSAVEALMASAGALARGIERATSEHNAFLKAAYEDSVAALKATASSKSMQETIDLQTEYVRAQTAKNLSQFSKLSEHWTATAKDVTEPLTQRYGELVEMVQAYRP